MTRRFHDAQEPESQSGLAFGRRRSLRAPLSFLVRFERLALAPLMLRLRLHLGIVPFAELDERRAGRSGLLFLLLSVA